jgi:hypothetical protein
MKDSQNHAPAAPPAPSAVPVGAGGAGDNRELSASWLKSLRYTAQQIVDGNWPDEKLFAAPEKTLDLLGHIDFMAAENTRLAARLREEEVTTADQARGMLERDEELRKLRAGAAKVDHAVLRAAIDDWLWAERGTPYLLELLYAAGYVLIPKTAPPASPLGKSEEGRGESGEGVQGE